MITRKRSLYQHIRPYLVVTLAMVIIAWAFSGIQFTGIKDSAGQILGAILSGLCHPDWSFVYSGHGEDLTSALLETLAIAFLGTIVSAIIAVPFAFWAAKVTKGFSLRSTTGKLILTIIRVFPELVLAIMFIKAVGPGAFAGVLAMGVHSIGMMGKLFSEGIENLNRGPEEAVIAAGGSRIDTLNWATLPAMVPEFINYTLYRFEIAVRSASILGIVGAGGVGAPLIFALSTRWWSRVGIILIGIIVMVTVIDWVSGAIRQNLLK
ncbi:phosphonate ABC transporter, permease protein PhnE [Convivina intestini]|uniref:Phosphonate transport system permease protein n=1 Tax=Convivina intestini TaxID=1505726 RepID=A0A2U1DF18_9LACO|nr:phosphonate ABC transporter, permease protein PhnE [Convivina intestini]PVY86275.1 phosphonate transport system permease protein [Convivina intestini]CAH1851093.1 Phosphate-import permease protein PhnE [Convivina intestini]SDB82088.1 phosphonate transport system permease protein [Leuconostocaceae bacterium R-53105]